MTWKTKQGCFAICVSSCPTGRGPNRMKPLAHSPRGPVPAQPYLLHVDNVEGRAVENARRATAYYSGDATPFVGAVKAAALYHDLGKLDEDNQDVLRRESVDPLPVRHEDAGVA